MAQRRKLPADVAQEVLLQSRRRCCICFGLHRDDGVKPGQIAHLDRDRENDSAANLAFLCLVHHDEYDSRTSQSKGLTQGEVVRFRTELIDHFSTWMADSSRDAQQHLLNFLAYRVTLDEMANAAVDVGSSVVVYGEEHAFDVLITDRMEYSDGDLYAPHLAALDMFAAWGWLSYSSQQSGPEGMPTVVANVLRRRICDDVAWRIFERKLKREGKATELLSRAKYEKWSRLGAAEKLATDRAAAR